MAQLQLLWFKRDLRLHDHAALCAAAARGPLLPLVIVEPQLWAQPDRSARQFMAWTQAVRELWDELRRRDLHLCVRIGEAVAVLAQLRAELGAFTLHSHQETDSGWTYARDRAVAQWCREQSVEWLQPRQNGVQRGLQLREGWAAQWEREMRAPLLAAPATLHAGPRLRSDRWPTPESLGLAPQTPGQSATRAATLQRLEAFLQRDGEGYRRGISSPLTAERASSRLSVGLCWGTVSLREITQRSRAVRAALDAEDPQQAAWRRSLASFDKRLHWHCHFIQKLETAPRLEFRNLHPAYDGLREADFDAGRFAAWSRGETGWPFVDACMRCLNHGGWLNFRMRAMLMSVASYQLWLHWRPTALHLARQFTDYEPGIHYAQAQMQSGTTGINTYRIYNPIKQGFDQDPEGVFIRRWVPELAALPTPLLHEPWTASASALQQAGLRLGEHYPLPIVDAQQAMREARTRLAGLRAGAAYRSAADALQQQLGSKASGLSAAQRGVRGRRRKPDAAQRSLF